MNRSLGLFFDGPAADNLDGGAVVGDQVVFGDEGGACLWFTVFLYMLRSPFGALQRKRLQ